MLVPCIKGSSIKEKIKASKVNRLKGKQENPLKRKPSKWEKTSYVTRALQVRPAILSHAQRTLLGGNWIELSLQDG